MTGQTTVSEAEPPFAGELFGVRIGLAREFTTQLAVHGEQRGLIGPLELKRLWTRHIVNSALVAPLLRPGRVGDVGSGAGLPGIVLAIARPDVDFVLIEPMERRVEWLLEMVSLLALNNVEVVRARAEEARGLPALDQVTARAVSSLRTLIPLAAPLVRAGGQVLFLKGMRVEQEISSAAKAIRTSHLTEVEILVLGESLGTEVTRVFRATVD